MIKMELAKKLIDDDHYAKRERFLWKLSRFNLWLLSGVQTCTYGNWIVICNLTKLGCFVVLHVGVEIGVNKNYLIISLAQIWFHFLFIFEQRWEVVKVVEINLWAQTKSVESYPLGGSIVEIRWLSLIRCRRVGLVGVRFPGRSAKG